MNGIAISPHILTLKPEPFTPLKRLKTLQTPKENLVGFSSVYIVLFRKFSSFLEMLVSRSVILSGNFLEQKIEVEESRLSSFDMR